MIARFRMALPFAVYCSVDVLAAEPQAFELAGLSMRLYPPYRSRLRPEHHRYDAELPAEVRRQLLDQDLDQQPGDNPKLNGQPSLECNASRLDVHKDGDFDRELGVSEDPPVALLRGVVNDWLTRFRLLVGPMVRLAGEDPRQPWHMQYLDDSGNELPPMPGLHRNIAEHNVRVESLGLNQELWDRIGSVPWGYTPLPARTLLVDARGSLPDVGSAVVLAATALETCIVFALDVLAPMYGVQPSIWGWMNERGDYLKEPTVGERFDSLLYAVSRRSLKNEPRLWEAFKNLREARNKFAHEGRATIGGVEVDAAKATELLVRASEIVDWVENLLPTDHRTPKWDPEALQVETTFLLHGAPASGGHLSEQPGDAVDEVGESEAGQTAEE